MKIYILAAPLLLLSACDATPPQNAVVEDVAANNMIADEVTEVQDDSAGAQVPEAPSREPGTGTAVPPPLEPLTPSIEPHVTQSEREARIQGNEPGGNQ